MATFLGSPQMNLVEARLEDRGGHVVVEGAGFAFAADEERFGSALVPGRSVEAGVRPHDLRIARTGEPTVATLRVELLEFLGFEAYAHGWTKASGPKVVVRLDGDDARGVQAGSELGLFADPCKIHLFDARSGIALDAR